MHFNGPLADYSWQSSILLEKKGWRHRVVSVIEDLAFSPPYDLAPPHPLPPLSPASCFSFSVFLCVAGRAYWREGRGSYDDRRAWSSTYHSILEIISVVQEVGNEKANAVGNLFFNMIGVQCIQVASFFTSIGNVFLCVSFCYFLVYRVWFLTGSEIILWAENRTGNTVPCSTRTPLSRGLSTI